MNIIPDSTAKIKKESAENSNLLAFIDQFAPIPAASIDKPKPKLGEVAFSVNGGKGVVTLLEGKDMAVNMGKHGDRFVRQEEWSSEPWSKEDVAAWNAACIERSRLARMQEKGILDAWRARKELAKTFLK